MIVGGGISGLATAVALLRTGFAVELVERRSAMEALGSGITLIGPAMRALADLEVLPDCLDHGYGTHEFRICDSAGGHIASHHLPSPRPGLPGLMGLQRPDLHRILLDRAIADGLTVRTGTSPVTVARYESGARIVLDNGDTIDADLVIGADGLRSQIRTLLFGDVEPSFIGQACIRALLPRLPEVTCEMQFHGVAQRHVGLTPTGQDSMYLYCCVPITTAETPDAVALPRILRDYLAPFGGPVAATRNRVQSPDQLHYAVLETVILPAPWHSGHCVVLGDAAHCTTPQLAAGAAMCLEDAVVLAEELGRAATISDGLESFTKRRADRCRYVVEASSQLSRWQMQPDASSDEQQRLSGEAIAALAVAP
ncbi:FAD-dependent monooxygenase [Mycolicibacter sinensis]